MGYNTDPQNQRTNERRQEIISMSTIRKRDILALVVVVAIILAMIPTMVLAASNEGSITGEYTLGDSAPTVDNVTLYTTANATATTMIPETEFVVKVTVTDNNTLRDLDNVTVTIFYDADGSYDNVTVPTTGNPKTCGIITCSSSDNWSTHSWATDFGGSTRWAFDNVSSAIPTSMGASTGTFEFYFTPGAVATMTVDPSRWHINATAVDSSSKSGTNYQANLLMAWYGELDITPATNVTWTNPTAGMTDKAADANVSVTYIANGTYYSKVAATGTWGSATLVPDNSTLGSNAFRLKAYYNDTVGSAQIVQSYSTYSASIYSGGQTTEAGQLVDTNTLWLSLGSPFTNGTYSGTIYYKISNS